MLRLSVDVGGTFTDLVLIDIQRQLIWVEKVTSTPGSGDGVLRGIRKITERAGVGFSDVELLFHGLTIATNAWLTRSGARVALITTEGFRDVLDIGDQRRPLSYSLNAPKPAPLVARSQVVEVSERVDAFGNIVTALSQREIRRVVDRVAALQPEAIAITLIFGYANPVHEQMLAEALKAEFPHLPIYAASKVAPQIKEYPRANTTAAAAYVGPRVIDYTTTLEGALEKAGFNARLVYMRSDGGASTPDSARANPLNLLMSGPAGGVIGAQEVARILKLPNIISFDMGGTSTDLAMVRDQVAEVGHARIVDGLPVLIPMLDIVAISAGGGSIGYVDPAGGLHVGPQSAGAVPGPACYQRGGDKPTLTDATVALGFLDVNAFADADVDLSRDAARSAVESHIAQRLGTSIEDAAIGMVSIATAGMGEAIRRLSVERGYDPSEFALIAFGGAGGLFAPFLLRDLNLNCVVFPPSPGVFAAHGLQHADIRHTGQLPYLRSTAAITPIELADAYQGISSELDARLASDGIPAGQRRFYKSADMRYVGQFHELNVAFDPSGSDFSLATLRRQFIAQHERNLRVCKP